jgi:hypothetical protein
MGGKHNGVLLSEVQDCGSVRQLEPLIDLHLHMKMHVKKTPPAIYFIYVRKTNKMHTFLILYFN